VNLTSYLAKYRIFLHTFVDVISYGMRYQVFGFIVSFISFVTRHIIPELAHRRGIGLRITEDYGISG